MYSQVSTGANPSHASGHATSALVLEDAEDRLRFFSFCRKAIFLVSDVICFLIIRQHLFYVLKR